MAETAASGWEKMYPSCTRVPSLRPVLAPLLIKRLALLDAPFTGDNQKAAAAAQLGAVGYIKSKSSPLPASSYL